MRHTWGGYQVVLASTSSRRRELLVQVGLEPEIRPSRTGGETREKKSDIVIIKLSRQKAEGIVSGCLVGTMVIGADTVASVGNEMLGRLGTPMRVYKMLEKIRGRTHQVYTSATVLLCQGKDRCHGTTLTEYTDVHVYPMTCREVKEYARCGGPLDKAGVYETQGRFATYIKGADEDYTSVVGLSVGCLYQEIKRLLEDREDD